jgi:hypothetical protein
MIMSKRPDWRAHILMEQSDEMDIIMEKSDRMNGYS